MIQCCNYQLIKLARRFMLYKWHIAVAGHGSPLGCETSRQSANRWQWEYQLYAPADRPVRCLVLVSESTPGPVAPLEVLGQLRISLTSYRIEPETFRLVKYAAACHTHCARREYLTGTRVMGARQQDVLSSAVACCNSVDLTDWHGHTHIQAYRVIGTSKQHDVGKKQSIAPPKRRLVFSVLRFLVSQKV
jgi:hypothetical protein